MEIEKQDFLCLWVGMNAEQLHPDHLNLPTQHLDYEKTILRDVLLQM